ncbi:hypothetical protein VCRA2123O444_220015 [Vibrio crassostreae]|nr:hypothetical protein VCRA2110O182_170016 [Vibrio crassostreae]CAK1813493.1 hypothetical protein VCRA2118O429_180088 [Vibrio crassostreae]CAK1830652.1 hypothetical protein VCRA2117O428_190086 [Vibrio crassostreae]CAK1831076.1 hypothetical protein VCRA2113O416_190087 [Vibrio crassostreae]CAK1831520.1 hypothetical protein VCRA2119O432_190086 [Vibrio crassostreae]
MPRLTPSAKIASVNEFQLKATIQRLLFVYLYFRCETLREYHVTRIPS